MPGHFRVDIVKFLNLTRRFATMGLTLEQSELRVTGLQLPRPSLCAGKPLESSSHLAGV